MFKYGKIYVLWVIKIWRSHMVSSRVLSDITSRLDGLYILKCYLFFFDM